jgi:hypothetical protein
MRRLIWIAALAALTQSLPAAYAESDSGTKAGAYNSGPHGVPPAVFTPAPLDPANCGTPDEAKPCGPMPRRALATYPGPRHQGG